MTIGVSPHRGGTHPGPEWNGGLGAERRCTSQVVRFQETLLGLAMIDEGFVQHEAGLGLGPVHTSTLDPEAAALLQLVVSVAIG